MAWHYNPVVNWDAKVGLSILTVVSALPSLHEIRPCSRSCTMCLMRQTCGAVFKGEQIPFRCHGRGSLCRHIQSPRPSIFKAKLEGEHTEGHHRGTRLYDSPWPDIFWCLYVKALFIVLSFLRFVLLISQLSISSDQSLGSSST